MNIAALAALAARMLNIFRKELLIILKDPANRALLLVPVIVESLVFGYAATYDLKHASYALLDQNRSTASSELIARLDASGVFERRATLSNEAGIAAVIDTQQALAVIHIGPLFEQKLRSGQPAAVQVIIDARNSATANSAQAYLAGIVAQFNTQWRKEHGLVGPPLTLETRAWYNPNLDTRWFMLPALIAALSMIQTLMLSALSVAREREQGTFDQLLVTPYTPTEIMVGKAVPPILIGLIQSTFILLISVFWFRIPMAGSLFSLYVGLLLFTIAIVGIGLSISALSATMQQAMLYTFVLIMPLMLLSGLATPVENMPAPMQWLTSINPLRYGIDLVHRIYLEGTGLGSLAGDILPLMAIAAISLPLAAWLFRHRLA